MVPFLRDCNTITQIATSRYPLERYPDFQLSVAARFQFGGGLKKKIIESSARVQKRKMGPRHL
jgi:hypothetical protein